MAGVNTILRIIGAALVLLILFVVTAVGFELIEPIWRSLGQPAESSWERPNFMLFMSLGLVGLVFVVITWLIVAPIRNDVRQDVRRP